MATVLVVDDNPTMVEMISTVLKIHGYEPQAALSGEQALGLVAQRQPDLILLDMSMPGLDGLETLRRLRGMPEGEDIPVVVVTAAPEIDLEERVLLAGGNATLHKPVGMDVLVGAVARQVQAAQRMAA